MRACSSSFAFCEAYFARIETVGIESDYGGSLGGETTKHTNSQQASPVDARYLPQSLTDGTN